jgi:hypothetical protein
MRDGSLGSCCIQRDIMLLIWLVRIVELVFFAGVAGCVVTIALSWYSICKEEFTSNK